MLDNRYALLFIRGERPVMDEKFDILKHPNIALTTDGKGKPYLHGEVTQAVASMILLGFGIVQIGLSLKSHDPSQRANGFLDTCRRRDHHVCKRNPDIDRRIRNIQ